MPGKNAKRDADRAASREGKVLSRSGKSRRAKRARELEAAEAAEAAAAAEAAEAEDVEVHTNNGGDTDGDAHDGDTANARFGLVCDTSGVGCGSDDEPSPNVDAPPVPAPKDVPRSACLELTRYNRL